MIIASSTMKRVTSTLLSMKRVFRTFIACVNVDWRQGVKIRIIDMLLFYHLQALANAKSIQNEMLNMDAWCKTNEEINQMILCNSCATK